MTTTTLDNHNHAEVRMVAEAEYSAMKAKMPEIKLRFQTRHYTQCATLCDRLLMTHAEIHPLHRAYLHFYLAMSHDSMAREASIKYRSTELDLAERHYLAAIDVLSPHEPQKLDDIPEHSPTSATSEDEQAGRARRVSDAASLASEQSAASSATSFAEHQDEESNCEPTPKRSNYFKAAPPSRHILDDFTMSPTLTRRRPAPITTSAHIGAYTSSPVSRLKENFSADLDSFICMVRTHLASVRGLKEIAPPPVVRFSFSRSRSSTSSSSRPASRDSSNAGEPERGVMRLGNKRINFRPRFDPTSVQRLCKDALSEI